MQRSTRASLLRIGIGFVLFIIAVLLQIAARNHRGFADWYTDTVYPFWVETIGRFWSFFPYSVVELLLYGLMFSLVVAACFGVVHGIRRTKRWSDVLLAGSSIVVLLIGGLFFFYTVWCGMNYHNTPFSERNGMKVGTYTVEQLTSYCKEITKEVNRLSKTADRVKLKNQKENRKEAVKAMHGIGKEYRGLSGYYPQPKGVRVSEILSYQQLTGIYSPFTVEANYNMDMTAYNIPFTMCHELSHLRGFMREDEANYIAYLACSHSESVEFQYSGALMAWIYSTNLLYDYAPETYQQLQDSLEEEVWKDLRENTIFWDKYDGAIAKMSDEMNDTYLKANKQTDGIASYDRMVNLLMAEYLSEE